MKRVSAFVVALVVTFFVMVGSARAEPIRVLVAVGHRLGAAGETPLKHAVRDATRVRDVFVQVGGVKPENAILLEEPTQAQLFAALDKAAAIARTHRPEEVSILFYFSGHGDRDRIHLGGERVPIRDIDAKLAATPAALRIVVADACRTGDSRSKGVTAEDAFAINIDGGGGTVASGVVHIHASADGEVAQESDELGGAVFTHYWVTGLAGAADTDGDARVTLAESYSFAYSQTLYRSARASGVVQRPAAQFDLKEAAPIVLTQTARSSGIRLPRASDMHYLVYGLGSHTVVGELWSSPDRSVALAMAPGKYVVQRRGGGSSAAAQIDVARNEQRELHASDFQAVPEEALAKKGGDLNLTPNELTIGYAAETTRLASLGHELSLRYGYAWDGGFALSVGAIGGIGSASDPGQDTHLDWIGIDALVEQRFRIFGNAKLRLGIGPRVLGVLQTLERTDADRVAKAGYDPNREFRGVAFGAHALVGVRIPFATSWFVEVDARGELLGENLASTIVPAFGVGGGASLGWSF